MDTDFHEGRLQSKLLGFWIGGVWDTPPSNTRVYLCTSWAVNMRLDKWGGSETDMTFDWSFLFFFPARLAAFFLAQFDLSEWKKVPAAAATRVRLDDELLLIERENGTVATAGVWQTISWRWTFLAGCCHLKCSDGWVGVHFWDVVDNGASLEDRAMVCGPAGLVRDAVMGPVLLMQTFSPWPKSLRQDCSLGDPIPCSISLFWETCPPAEKIKQGGSMPHHIAHECIGQTKGEYQNLALARPKCIF